MAFVPDTTQPTSVGRFVPDTPEDKTGDTAPRRMTIAEQLTTHPIVRGVQGVMEAGTEMATGLGTQIAGGLGGAATTVGNLVRGKSFDEAMSSGADVVRDVSDVAYKSRTPEGKLLTKALMYLPEKATEGWREIGGAVGGAVGGEQGRIAGEELGGVGMQALMAVAPAPSMLRQARVAKAPTYQDAAATYPDRQTTPQIRQEAILAPQRAAAEAAKRQGVAVDLPDLDIGGIHTKARRMMASGADVQQAMGAVNKGVPEMKLKQEVGIAPETSLDYGAILKAREALAGPKNAISNMEGFFGDDVAVSQIRSLVPERTVGMGREHAAAVERVNEIVRDINNGTGTGGWAMGSIESLRKAARDIYNREDLTPEIRNTAEIYKGTADAIEGMIERKLTTEAPELLDQYRTNRQGMAKTYLLEDILDQNTGKINLDKLARQTANDPSITGTFSDFGKIYAHSPESFKSLPKESLSTRITRATAPGALGAVIGTTLAPGIGTLGGIAAGAYMGKMLSGRAARSLASPRHQSQYTTPRGPVSRESLGYSPVADALRMTDDTTPMGGTGGTQVPLAREPLDVGFTDATPTAGLQMPVSDMSVQPRLNPMYSQRMDPQLELPSVPYNARLPETAPDMAPMLPTTESRMGLPSIDAEATINALRGNPVDVGGMPIQRGGMEQPRAPQMTFSPEPKLEWPQLLPDQPMTTTDLGAGGFGAPIKSGTREVPNYDTLEYRMPTQDFPLKQEMMNELAPTTDALRQQLSDLYQLRDKQQGMWKKRTQAQIDQLEQSFREGLGYMGIRNPQDGYGALYSSGNPTQLGLEKVKALREFK